jgi:cation diffusion facilitator CzcD-associated flavoprotein CzcO
MIGRQHLVAVIGAGPYGLATAAHLRAAGIEPLVFGDVMGAWKQMPKGMFLRSYREATSIGDPAGRFTIDRFARDRGRAVSTPVAISDFVEYGQWFQSCAVSDVDRRFVSLVEWEGDGFRLELTDGSEARVRRVVVAAGIEPFAYVPPELALNGSSLVTHSSAHQDFEGFRDLSVLIVGGGQSALEWGALAHEAGASVEIVAHRPLRFLRGESLHNRAGLLRPLLYPSWGVGPPGLNWVMGQPNTFRQLPTSVGTPLAQRAIRPAGAAWLRSRLAHVAVTSGTSVHSIRQTDGKLTVALRDGSDRLVDHLISATGYRIDISRYPFLSEELIGVIRRRAGFPLLTSGYESSVRGLHFLGAPAAGVMGPGMRFVSHSGIAGAAVARAVAHAR